MYDIYGADKDAWNAYTRRNSDWDFYCGFVDDAGAWVVKPIYADALIRTPEQ